MASRSKEFEAQKGKGRPKGSRNKKTVHFEEGFQAGVEAVLRSIGNQSSEGSERSDEKSSSDSKDFVGGIAKGVKGLASSPLTAGILAGLTAFGGVPAAIGGLWLAEEYVKIPIKHTKPDGIIVTEWIDFPPLLHTLFAILKQISQWLNKEGAMLKSEPGEVPITKFLNNFFLALKYGKPGGW